MYENIQLQIQKKDDNDDNAEAELLPLPEVDGGPSIQTPL